MRKLRYQVILVGILLLACCGFLGIAHPAIAGGLYDSSSILLAEQPTTEHATDNEAVCPGFGEKIDLNNANVVAFTDCSGFYPSLASLIIQNSPYQKVEDVLEIPELTDSQKALLKTEIEANHFTVTDPVVPLEMRMPPRPVMR